MQQPMQQMPWQPLVQMPVQSAWAWDEVEPKPRETKREKREERDAFLYPGHPGYSPIDVTVKNTFIELPAPRTPSPTGRTCATAVANTCPPKYAMGDQAREEWEQCRSQAEEAV